MADVLIRSTEIQLKNPHNTLKCDDIYACLLHI
jgi:hypothetical protein